jgi:hypothetical protein
MIQLAYDYKFNICLGEMIDMQVVLQMVDYQMLKEDNAITKKELENAKMWVKLIFSAACRLERLYRRPSETFKSPEVSGQNSVELELRGKQ